MQPLFVEQEDPPLEPAPMPPSTPQPLLTFESIADEQLEPTNPPPDPPTDDNAVPDDTPQLPLENSQPDTPAVVIAGGVSVVGVPATGSNNAEGRQY